MTQGQSGGLGPASLFQNPGLKTALRRLAVAGVVGVTLLAGLVLIAAFRLPSLSRLETAGGESGNPAQVAIRGGGGPDLVRLEALPPYVPRAFIVTEDRWFYWHPGFNPWGILRSQVHNMRHHDEDVPLRGGSTITQQVARNLFLSRDQTLGRKAQELILAMALEVRYSKREILTVYLNRTDFGGGAIGLEAASEHYFGRPASRLTVGQTALLAGVLKGTDRYSPVSNPDRAQRRAGEILDNMVRRHVITTAQRDDAFKSLALGGATPLSPIAGSALASRSAMRPLSRSRAAPATWRAKLSAKAAASCRCSWTRVSARMRSSAKAVERRVLARAADRLPGRPQSWRRWLTQWSSSMTIDDRSSRPRGHPLANASGAI